MLGRLKDLTFGRHGEQIISLTVQADFRSQFDELKDADLDIAITKHRMKRSKDANAYFHVLVNKIAEYQNLGEDEVKRDLVLEYGAFAKDGDGNTVGFKIPASVDVSGIYPYTKMFDRRTENGRDFNCYLVYKRTHDLDSKEMARLIDGAIYEAQALGIETDTPEQIARYKEEWQR